MRGALGLAAALWMAACGGREAPGVDAGASSIGDGGSGDGGSSGDGSFPVCPTNAPAVGSSCFMSGEGCAYIDPSGACEAFVCDGAHWQTSAEGC